jgi:hypothetical protein
MDEERFDRFTRRLARSQSRRAFLAGVIAGGVTALSRRSTSAQTSLPCSDANGRPKPFGTSCIDPSRPCLVSGFCDGRNPECIADWLEPVGAPCATGIAHPCALSGTCNSAGDCVPTVPMQAGTPCRPHTGDPCLPLAFCDGVSLSCPALPGPESTCAPAAGDCAEASTCDGFGQCIPGQLKSLDTACRPAVGDCDVTEFCDGFSADCPADSFAPEGTPCGIKGSCSAAGICLESSCGKQEEFCDDVCRHKSEFRRDDLNCGSCGIACAPGSECRGGTCRPKEA